jgi:hypothetical protein
MNDRDDPTFEDGESSIESAGKEHDPFRYEESQSGAYSYQSDDTPEDDGEADFCPDFVDMDD